MGLNAISPAALVIISVFSIQFGAGLATQIFPFLGAEGTVAIRIGISALLLMLFAGSKLRTFKQLFLNNIKLLLVFGLCMAAMNLFFYMSIARIPMGAAVAIEFIGPLGIAAIKSKRKIHLAWVSLAALGIVLLSPLSGTQLDAAGMLYALLAGVGWALFIVLAERVGKHASGNEGLAIGMMIAAVAMLPLAIPAVPALLSNQWVLLAAIGVAVLSTALPFTFEFAALRRLPARNYGILVSIEPAVAALVGAWLLGDRIGIQGMIAVLCVVVAAVGITVTEKRECRQ